ncbi:MAG: T9SS type A sorting domain-containing protein [Candidatus Stahlbacteria bacterium]|nr:T9SS type A sorting domain-containing protein [Candidatus Stahlbacteria bacterium]
MLIIYIIVLFYTNNATQKLVEIPIRTYDEVYKISRLKVAIVSTSPTSVKAILTDKEIERIKNLGFYPQIIIADYQAYAANLLNLPGYHTYDEVVNDMITVANTYPNITFLDTLGYSVGNRLILAMKISDNANLHENEPGIRFTGAHHGDEHISTEIVLYLIHYLTDNYSIDPYIQELVDSREIWLIPMVNPDGVFHSTRANANGTDLNRDYGYMWQGLSPAPFSQLETQAIRTNAIQNRFTLGFDYHSEAQIVNTLWDYTPIFTQDDTIIMHIGKEYADSMGYWLVRGYYWYEVHGSCQDAMYGCEGILDYTIETPQPDTPTPVCESNRPAMLAMIKRAGDRGIAGIVTDSITGAPLDARIELTPNPQPLIPIYTDPRLGDYHRLLLPGSYTLKASANGYLTKVITDISVGDSVTNVNTALTPNDKYYAYRIVWANVSDPNDAHNNHTLTCDMLGAPDSEFLSLGVGGDIVLDMGILITDSFIVYEGEDSIQNEGYKVYVANNWNGPYDLLGLYYGTQKIDITQMARYIRITDDGGSDTDSQYAGFDLDAIEGYRIVNSEEREELEVKSLELKVYPNLFIEVTEIRVWGLGVSENPQLLIYDLAGRMVRKFLIPNPQSLITISWDGRDNLGKKVRTGVYFAKLTSGNSSKIKKLILIR